MSLTQTRAKTWSNVLLFNLDLIDSSPPQKINASRTEWYGRIKGEWTDFNIPSWIFVSHNVVNEIRFENFSIDFNQLLKLVRSSVKLIWRDWAKPIKIKKSQNKSCIRRFKNNRLSSLLKLLPKISLYLFQSNEHRIIYCKLHRYRNTKVFIYVEIVQGGKI